MYMPVNTPTTLTIYDLRGRAVSVLGSDRDRCGLTLEPFVWIQRDPALRPWRATREQLELFFTAYSSR